MRALALLACGLLACGSAGAQDDDTPMVQVDGLKNPQMQSYRAVVAGLDMFNKQHGLAPAAPEVRFRVLRKDEPVHEQNLSLRIASDDESVQLPISADGMFSVPRSESLYDAKADLIFNWKKNAYKVTPEVRTPGLPDNVRRLGDLRLECKVSLAMVKEEIPFWVVAMVNTVLLSSDWCMTTFKDAKFWFRGYAPVASAKLTFGERSIDLKTKKHHFEAPTNDRSWPDDALIQLEFAPQVAQGDGQK